jgi:hypothetical protein
VGDHRIGGSGVENLRLKAKEAQLNPPGISVLKAASPAEAVRQIREAFPNAEELQEIAHPARAFVCQPPVCG